MAKARKPRRQRLGRKPRAEQPAKKVGPQGRRKLGRARAPRSRRPKSRPPRRRTATACRRPSNKPYGQDGKALTGVRILDFTHVQSGPTCTQLLAWFGADVIKVERPGVGDITRGQLVDVPGADSLYFTMLNHNKRSITIDSKHPQGKRVLDALIKSCDVLVENFAPGALDRMGLTWEHIHKTQPAHDRRLGQGLRPRSLRGLQGLRERRAMRRRLGLDHRLPRRPAAGDRRADRRQRHRPASRARHRLGALPAQPHRPRPEGARRHAGRRAQPLPRQAARPAAPRARPAHRIQPVRRGRSVRRCDAARRQRLRRRPARLDLEVQGLGDRSQRLHLLHHPGAGLGERSATSSASRPGRPIRNTPRRRRGCRS